MSGENVAEPWGLLLLDKPEGPTSHTLVTKAGRILGIKRVGHAGTLDPMATGLMLVGVGRATRLMEYLVGLDKTYVAKIRLGIETDSFDRQGNVEKTSDASGVTPETVREALKSFEGVITQRPPVHSAIKVDGVPLHRRVRRGEEVEAPLREVTISSIKLLSMELPDIIVEIDCGSGTYIRSLARDLGEKLGVGATLWELRRTRCGSFSVEDALKLEEVAELGVERLIDPGKMVESLPRVDLTPAEMENLKHGRPIRVYGENLDGREFAAFDAEGKLFALCTAKNSVGSPRKVFV